eukprot:3938861-Rhodomonas_salina.1
MSNLANGDSITSDGSGPMDGLDTSTVVLMWGSIWEPATGVKDEYRTVSNSFLRRYESLGIITNLDGKAHIAWMLSCMDQVEETIARDVHDHAAKTMGEKSQYSELFARYIRASAHSCYGSYPQAMKDEFEEIMAMGDAGCIGLRVLSMKRNLPDVGTRRVRVDPNDPTSEIVSKQVDIYVKTSREDMKEFFVNEFSEPGFRPPLISYSIFDSPAEPQVEEGTLDKIIAGAPPKFQDMHLVGQLQTRPSESM